MTLSEIQRGNSYRIARCLKAPPLTGEAFERKRVEVQAVCETCDPVLVGYIWLCLKAGGFWQADLLKSETKEGK